MKKRIRNILIILACLLVMVGVVIPGAFWIRDAYCITVNDYDLRLELPIIPDEDNAFTYLVQATNFIYEPYSYNELYDMTTNEQWDAGVFEAFIKTNVSQFALVDRALDRVGPVPGIKTYMGSMAVEDRDVMRALLEELGERELFFVDSTDEQYSLAGGIGEAHDNPP